MEGYPPRLQRQWEKIWVATLQIETHVQDIERMTEGRDVDAFDPKASAKQSVAFYRFRFAGLKRSLQQRVLKWLPAMCEGSGDGAV